MDLGSGLALGLGSISAAVAAVKLFGKRNNGYMTKETCQAITSGHQRQLDSIEKKVDETNQKVDKILTSLVDAKE